MSETGLLTKIVALENLHNALVDRVAVLEQEVAKLKQRKPPAPSHVPPPKYGPTHRQADLNLEKALTEALNKARAKGK